MRAARWQMDCTDPMHFYWWECDCKDTKMIYRGHRYTIGSQPCQNLQRGEGSFPGIANVHQCPKCCGNRTWCENCHTDHHDNGWETCKAGAYENADELRAPRAEVL